MGSIPTLVVSRVLAPLVFIALTSGCAGRMLDGKIYSLSESVAMPMKIQTSYGYGKISAHNPKTGEQFDGTYSGVREGQTHVTHAWISSAWAGTAYSSGLSQTSSNLATAIATLIGDKGTTLDCVMQIQPGLTPHGIGAAKDNDGREYRIQF